MMQAMDRLENAHNCGTPHPPRPSIFIEAVDNGYIVNHGNVRKVYNNLFQVSKWLRAQAVEKKHEAHQTL